MKPENASKNHIKNRKKLLSGKYRKKEGLFLAEGYRCVKQLLENGVIEIIELLTDEKFEFRDIVAHNRQIFTLNSEDFSTISDTQTPQGVIAVCKIPKETEVNKLATKSGLIVAFDEIQDPGNLGTMIRTASWFGVNGLLVGDGTVDMFHPKVIRSTSGATGTIPFLKGDLPDLLNRLENEGYQIFLLDGSEKSVDLRNINLDISHKIILTVGNEGNGIQPNLFNSSRTAVRIEGKSDRVESLNAAVALSIGLYQLKNG